MTGILEQIVRRTREKLAAENADRRLLESAAADAAATREPFRFSAALRGKGVNLIAEIKAASPSAGSIVQSPDVEAIARSYVTGGAAAISVVTESDFFRGSRSWIRPVSRAAGLPVIMKDFVVDPRQVFGGVIAGADAMLLLASILSAAEIREFIRLLDGFGCDALVEVHDETELIRAVDAGARLIGVNNRDLRTFAVDLATSEHLGALMPGHALRVAESGIRTAQDVQRLRAAGFDAFLVGESLLRQNDRAAAVRELCGVS